MTNRDPSFAGPPATAWLTRVFQLGEEPRDDLVAVTTAEQRLAMVWELSQRMWALTGRPFPNRARQDLPGVVLRLP